MAAMETGAGAAGAGVVAELEVPKRDIETLTFRSVKRSCDIFAADYSPLPGEHKESREAKLTCKVHDEYERVRHVAIPVKRAKKGKGKGAPAAAAAISSAEDPDLRISQTASKLVTADSSKTQQSMQLAIRSQESANARGQLVLRAPTLPKATWHPQWKLFRVISGHLGWVRSITVDPSNQWFVTGSADRTIKVWDLASGELKVSLTGHISAVRGVEVSSRHPYLFSAGEDKTVRCWDLERNQVIRHYHGHLSAVYDLKLHPTLDILFTGGRDSTIRVWDMRTKAQIHCLGGHTNTVGTIQSQAVDPQVISGSHDSTIRMWDLAAGRSICTLTNHKKSIRSIVIHPSEFTFASGGADNIKQWYLPDGKFIQNVSGHNAVINSLVVNPDGVLVSGADNGTLKFFDYKTGYKFQEMETIPQPGSLDSESGIFAMTYDRSWSRLLTAEADKTIKVYKEDDRSTEETHPVNHRANTLLKKARF